MSTCKYIIGETRAVTRRLIDEGVQVDFIMSSPPYLALRSYLPDIADDTWTARQERGAA